MRRQDPPPADTDSVADTTCATPDRNTILGAAPRGAARRGTSDRKPVITPTAHVAFHYQASNLDRGDGKRFDVYVRDCSRTTPLVTVRTARSGEGKRRLDRPAISERTLRRLGLTCRDLIPQTGRQPRVLRSRHRERDEERSVADPAIGPRRPTRNAIRSGESPHGRGRPKVASAPNRTNSTVRHVHGRHVYLRDRDLDSDARERGSGEGIVRQMTPRASILGWRIGMRIERQDLDPVIHRWRERLRPGPRASRHRPRSRDGEPGGRQAKEPAVQTGSPAGVRRVERRVELQAGCCVARARRVPARRRRAPHLESGTTATRGPAPADRVTQLASAVPAYVLPSADAPRMAPPSLSARRRSAVGIPDVGRRTRNARPARSVGSFTPVDRRYPSTPAIDEADGRFAR